MNCASPGQRVAVRSGTQGQILSRERAGDRTFASARQTVPEKIPKETIRKQPRGCRLWSEDSFDCASFASLFRLPLQLSLALEDALPSVRLRFRALTRIASISTPAHGISGLGQRFGGSSRSTLEYRKYPMPVGLALQRFGCFQWMKPA